MHDLRRSLTMIDLVRGGACIDGVARRIKAMKTVSASMETAALLVAFTKDKEATRAITRAAQMDGSGSCSCYGDGYGYGDGGLAND